MRITRLIIIFLFLCAYLPPAFSYDGLVNGDLLVKEADTVEEAVDIVTRKLESLGFDMELVVDHAAAAASVEPVLRPTQVIFARPPKYLERRLLRKSPTTGIDLPLKFLVFDGGDDAVHLIYNSLGYLVDRHALKSVDPALRRLFRGLDQFGEVENGLVTIPSMKSYDETVDALSSVLDDRGFRIPLVLDFNKRNSSHHRYGRSRLPTLIVFGNPVVGTPLMLESQSVAIDLPQKFLVWEDRSGEVFITHNDPVFLGDRHGIVSQDMRLESIRKALAGLAASGAGDDSSVP